MGIGISSLCAFELFKEFGTSADSDASDDKFFNLAGIIIPVVGAFGRILWGLLGDAVSYKILFVVGNVVSVILQVGFLATSFPILWLGRKVKFLTLRPEFVKSLGMGNFSSEIDIDFT